MPLRNISGYITDGGLAADFEQHFADEAPQPDVQPGLDLQAFANTLPAAAKAQLLAFDEIVRTDKQWRDLNAFALHYGYDLAKDEVSVELDGENVVAKVFPIGNDYGGNVYMVLPDGQVGIWSHDEGMVEDHTRFESLEQCLWTAMHCHLVKEQKLPFAEVKAVLDGFGEETGPRWSLEELQEYLEDEGLL